MARITTTGYIWIPPINHPNWKIQITRSDGIVDDVTQIIHEASITLGATEVIGDFSISIDNLDQSYTNVYSGGEIVEIFLDYSDASTRIFKGFIDKVGYTKDPVFKVNLKGRHYAEKLLSITVTQQYENIETSVILKDLFDKYTTDFTYANVNTSSTSVTVNWYQKSFWDCVIELCNAAGFDAYIDDDLDCHYFESKSIQNTTDAIVHNDNLFSVSDFGKDTTEIKNRVIVYGQDIENLPLIATAEDSSSQNALFVKEQIITDTNIITMTQAQERADQELARLKDSVDKGEVEAYPGLPTLQPGETLFISDPLSNLNGYYKVISFTHTFSEEGCKTKTTIEREIATVAKMIKERILSEQKLSDISNPYEMRYSWNFTFADSSMIETHDKTEISGGFLKLQVGESSGTMTSITKTTTSNIAYVEIRAIGYSLVGTTYEVSVDAGLNYQTIDPNTKVGISYSGNLLKIKVNLSSSATQIDSLVVLYR